MSLGIHFPGNSILPSLMHYQNVTRIQFYGNEALLFMFSKEISTSFIYTLIFFHILLYKRCSSTSIFCYLIWFISNRVIRRSRTYMHGHSGHVPHFFQSWWRVIFLLVDRIQMGPVWEMNFLNLFRTACFGYWHGLHSAAIVLIVHRFLYDI